MGMQPGRQLSPLTGEATLLLGFPVQAEPGKLCASPARVPPGKLCFPWDLGGKANLKAFLKKKIKKKKKKKKEKHVKTQSLTFPSPRFSGVIKEQMGCVKSKIPVGTLTRPPFSYCVTR